VLTDAPAIDKQKRLLEKDTGHFSMIKMLHLADLITELNGNSTCPKVSRTSLLTATNQASVVLCLYLPRCDIVWGHQMRTETSGRP